ncbi:MAG: TatD family hydrolase [archaeon]
MEFVDVHAHLNIPELDQDRERMLKNAKKAGVIAVIDAGETDKENRKILRLSKEFPLIRPALGHHPCSLDMGEAEKTADFIRQHKERIVAVGEIGLDYWKVNGTLDKESQNEIFGLFIDLAQELDLPVVVHSRSAGKYAIEILKQKNAEKVCMHSFDGDFKVALEGVALGYYFSIPPSIVRNDQLQKLAEIPLENLLLETDSPYLGPSKEEKNEPANVRIAAEEIARINELTLEEVADATTNNAKALFRI